MTPEEFKNKMQEISAAEDGGTEWRHYRADELMGELLIALGYEEGVKIFNSMDRWYD